MHYRHVIWVWLENHSYNEAVGHLPYLDRVGHRCGLATNYRSVDHPSLPNYIAATSGATQGIHGDCEPYICPVRARELFRQTMRAHRPWKGYAESMPVRCDLHSSGRYAARHNPAVYYTDIRRTCQSRDVPLGSRRHGLRHDLVTNHLPWFAFVTPNICHDMHDCSTAVGNRWLARWLPRIFGSTAWRSGRTALFVTFDEGDGSESGSACSRERRKHPSCHVATWVFGPAVRPGTRVNVRLTHYSLLRTTESMLGLPFLGHAKHARGMRHAFRL